MTAATGKDNVAALGETVDPGAEIGMSDQETFDRGVMMARRIWGDDFDSRKEYQCEFGIKELFPELSKTLIRGHLLPNVMSRPGLVLRERLMVALASNCMAGADYKTILRSKSMMLRNMRASAQNGISREQILEIIMHIAHYAGWSIATNALLVAKEVFSWEEKLQKGRSAGSSEQSEVGEKAGGSDHFQRGRSLLRQLEGGDGQGDFVEELFPDFWKMTIGHLFGDVWSRSALTLRERIIITFAINIALKFNPGIHANLRWALNNGISKEETLEIIMQVAHYRGYPAGINAIKVAREVFAQMS